MINEELHGHEGYHDERMLSVIAHEAATFIAREAGPGSLITVVRAEAPKEHQVVVFVSVFPEEKAQAAIAFLSRQREAFSDYLKSHARIRPLPRINFQIDNAPQGEILGS